MTENTDQLVMIWDKQGITKVIRIYHHETSFLIPIFVEIFQSGLKRQADWHCHPESHSAGLGPKPRDKLYTECAAKHKY